MFEEYACNKTKQREKHSILREKLLRAVHIQERNQKQLISHTLFTLLIIKTTHKKPRQRKTNVFLVQTLRLGSRQTNSFEK